MEIATLGQVHYFAALLIGIAVALSLIYVGAQIREYTRMLRFNAGDNVIQKLREIYTLMAQDGALADIYRNGTHDIDNISVGDKFRYILIVHNFFRVYEDAYYQKKEGRLHPRHWHGITEQFLFLKDLPGFQAFWRDRKFLFSDEFCNYYDKEVVPTQAHTRFDYQ
ncbi:MAG: hypothetical protein HOM55_07420 [Proteobacteria bacterium]|jgi:hypothetical protein|nr:hypothetical protein [Pseudomonadota bacterium]